LGDAAHAIVPFYGQGMNSGFEDCILFDDAIERFEGDIHNAITNFSKERRIDADAISELARINFVEMRDWVSEESFLTKKKISAWLFEQYPNNFIPVYSMVSFSHIPYRKALDEHHKQTKMLDEIYSALEEKHQFKNETTRGIFSKYYGLT